MLTEWRDTMGLILQQLGKDASNFTDDDFADAIDYLQKASDSGQIRQFTGNDYSSLLTNGTAYACMAWSGDIVQLQLDNPDIKFVQPEAGMMIWADEMMIPAMARTRRTPKTLMDFYYDPAVAAQLTAYVQYICPVKGAQQEMEKIDTTLVDNELIFPTAELLAKTTLFMGLDEATGAKYGAEFAKVKTSLTARDTPTGLQDRVARGPRQAMIEGSSSERGVCRDEGRVRGSRGHGPPMAGHLVPAGHEVTVWNRSPPRADAWLAEHPGGRVAATAREAAAAPTSSSCASATTPRCSRC